MLLCREKCHRCKNAENCSNSLKDESSTNKGCSTDIEDIDAIYSMVKSADRKRDREKVAKEHKLELDKYYEGEQHQSGRHVIVIVCQVLLMVVVSVLSRCDFLPLLHVCE
jgi:hypothetical protein